MRVVLHGMCNRRSGSTVPGRAAGILVLLVGLCLSVPCAAVGACPLANPSGAATSPWPHATRAFRVPVAPDETLHVEVSQPTRRAPVGYALLLPGPIGSAFAFRHVVRSLVDSGFNVIVADPLGMGRSNRPERADYALSVQASRMRVMIDELLPPDMPFVTAGIGTSATIALHLAAEMPDRVRGVLSVAGGGNDGQATSGLRLALAFSRVLNTPPGRAFARRRFTATLRAQSGDQSWVSDDVVAGYLMHDERDVRGLLRSLQRMANSEETRPIAARLPAIRAPVTLVVGNKPGVNAPTPAQIATLTRGLRQFRVDTLVGAGAMLHEERPVPIATWIARLHQRSGDASN